MKEAAASTALGLEASVQTSHWPSTTDNAEVETRPRIGFSSDLDIRPITLQPQFHPNSEDTYHVNDLLKFNDRQFVQNAYRAILKRPADEAGYSGFIEGLRSG